MLVMCSVKVDSLSYYIIVLLNYYYFFLDLKMKDALKFPFIMEKKSLIIIIIIIIIIIVRTQIGAHTLMGTGDGLNKPNTINL